MKDELRAATSVCMAEPPPQPAEQLPSALEAERLVLGSLISGTLAYEHAHEAVEPGDFYPEQHQQVFRRIGELYDRGESVNRVTVSDELQRHGQAEALADLDFAGDPGDLDSCLRLLAQKSILRQAIHASRKLTNECLLAQDPPAELLSRAERVIRSLRERVQPERTLRTPAEIIEQYPDGINGMLQPQRANPGIPSPWPSLNKIITGFRKSQLIVIAGRTGYGKSAMAGQITNAAASSDVGVVLFSLEMGADEILQRMACARAGVDSHKFRQGHLTEVERFDLQRAMTELSELPLWIDDSTGCTTAAIHSAVRKLRARHKVGLVVVDYLQLMENPGRRENRTQEVSAISRGLKLLAREFEIPVIALAQLNRGPETEKRRPVLSDLRESGSIEQDADVVLMLHLPQQGESDAAEVHIRKQRSGPRGTVQLSFSGHFTRFEERG